MVQVSWERQLHCPRITSIHRYKTVTASSVREICLVFLRLQTLDTSSALAQLNHDHCVDYRLLHTVLRVCVIMARSRRLWSTLLDVMTQWMRPPPVVSTAAHVLATVVRPMWWPDVTTVSHCRTLLRVHVLLAAPSLHRWTDQNSVTVVWRSGTVICTVPKNSRRLLHFRYLDIWTASLWMLRSGSVVTLSS